MIGSLPDTLKINGKDIPIRNTDFRIALIIFQAFEDPNLTTNEKAFIMMDALIGYKNIPSGYEKEAYEQCCWYLDGGKDLDRKRYNPKLMDWEQDEQMIFSAVNHVAGKELRTEKHIHWWTFLGYFDEIQEGLFSTVLSIRQKRKKNKKLEKWETEFYRENKDLVDFKPKRSDAEKKRMEEINRKFQ